jgi:hypothetical protein
MAVYRCVRASADGRVLMLVVIHRGNEGGIKAASRAEISMGVAI